MEEKIILFAQWCKPLRVPQKGGGGRTQSRFITAQVALVYILIGSHFSLWPMGAPAKVLNPSVYRQRACKQSWCFLTDPFRAKMMYSLAPFFFHKPQFPASQNTPLFYRIGKEEIVLRLAVLFFFPKLSFLLSNLLKVQKHWVQPSKEITPYL